MRGDTEPSRVRATENDPAPSCSSDGNYTLSKEEINPSRYGGIQGIDPPYLEGLTLFSGG